MTSIIGCTPENEDGNQQNWAILKCKRFLGQFRSQGICAKVEPRPSQTRNSTSPKLLEQDSIKLVLCSHWARVNLKTKIKFFIIIFKSWSKKINPSQNCGNPEILLGWCLMFVHREDMGNTSIYHICVHVYDVKLRNMQLVCYLRTITTAKKTWNHPNHDPNRNSIYIPSW